FEIIMNQITVQFFCYCCFASTRTTHNQSNLPFVRILYFTCKMFIGMFCFNIKIRHHFGYFECVFNFTIPYNVKSRHWYPSSTSSVNISSNLLSVSASTTITTFSSKSTDDVSSSSSSTLSFSSISSNPKSSMSMSNSSNSADNKSKS